MGITRSIVIICLIVYTINLEVSGHRGHKRKHNKHSSGSGSGSGRSHESSKTVLQRSPRDAQQYTSDSDNMPPLPTDFEMKSLCKEICATTRIGGEDESIIMTLKSYDLKQRSCYCVDQAGTGISITKTVYKPKPKKQLQAKANGAVNDKSRHGKSSRPKRQLIYESILSPDDDVIGMTITPPNPLRLPVSKQMYTRGSHSRPYPIHPSGCSPYTCTDECPFGCDSLCRQNRECYCSCPEDMNYEYYDDGPSFSSIFG